MTRPGAALLQRRRRSADVQRQARTAQVLEIVERFVYDLGLLIAGRAPQFDEYLDGIQARRLCDSVRPALSSGEPVHPDFGEYAQVRIEGDLLADTAPLHVEVDFEDRSVRCDAAGRPLTRHRRAVRVSAVIDAGRGRILHHRIAFV